MRRDGHDPIESDPDGTVKAVLPTPLDAAESTWDPWLWALYLREVAEKRPPILH